MEFVSKYALTPASTSSHWCLERVKLVAHCLAPSLWRCLCPGAQDLSEPVFRRHSFIILSLLNISFPLDETAVYTSHDALLSTALCGAPLYICVLHRSPSLPPPIQPPVVHCYWCPKFWLTSLTEVVLVNVGLLKVQTKFYTKHPRKWFLTISLTFT